MPVLLHFYRYFTSVVIVAVCDIKFGYDFFIILSLDSLHRIAQYYEMLSLNPLFEVECISSNRDLSLEGNLGKINKPYRLRILLDFVDKQFSLKVFMTGTGVL